jgi:hypothetical protein
MPLVEYSKVVRQTSGDVPPRHQVMDEPSQARLWGAGSVASSRAIR